MKYKVQFSPQKNNNVNTKHNIEKQNINKLKITIDDLLDFEFTDTDQIIKCNNIEFTKNPENNKFNNFVIDTYVVNLIKIDTETMYIELLKHYNTKNPEFTTEEQEY